MGKNGFIDGEQCGTRRKTVKSVGTPRTYGSAQAREITHTAVAEISAVVLFSCCPAFRGIKKCKLVALRHKPDRRLLKGYVLSMCSLYEHFRLGGPQRRAFPEVTPISPKKNENKSHEKAMGTRKDDRIPTSDDAMTRQED